MFTLKSQLKYLSQFYEVGVGVKKEPQRNTKPSTIMLGDLIISTNSLARINVFFTC